MACFICTNLLDLIDVNVMQECLDLLMELRAMKSSNWSEQKKNWSLIIRWWDWQTKKSFLSLSASIVVKKYFYVSLKFGISFVHYCWFKMSIKEWVFVRRKVGSFVQAIIAHEMQQSIGQLMLQTLKDQNGCWRCLSITNSMIKKCFT